MASPLPMPSPRIVPGTRRRTRGAAVMAALVIALGGVTVVAAPAAAKGKAPVKLSGKVNNKGKATIQNGAVDIEADNFYFAKTFLKGAAGNVTVEIENESGTTHSFTIDDQKIDEVIDAGTTATVTVALTDGKAVNFYCKFHKGSGMQGALYTAAGTKATGSNTKNNGSGSSSEVPGY